MEEKKIKKPGYLFPFRVLTAKYFNKPQKNHNKMKKFFAIAFIAATMVACNNSGDKKEGETTDTTAAPAPAPADTTATPAPADTTAAPAPAPADSTAK